MIDPNLIPTRLVHPDERPAVTIVDVVPPSRFLAWRIFYLLSKWALVSFWLRSRGQQGRIEAAIRLRRTFEQLGGIWLKVGQLISLRIDVFSPELCAELAKLQDRANGFPFDFVRRIVEGELGAPLTRYFDEFEEKPFSAASIGQLHMAHLRLENVWVAVKVQRPYLVEYFIRELALIGRITNTLHRLSIWRHVRWRSLHWELQHILEEEIDHRFEASNIRRMRKSLRRHNIYVPRVFGSYCSRRVLVMEFITGALMSDYIHMSQTDPAGLMSWVDTNNIDPQLLGRRLGLSLMRQVLEDNLYHGDLHPGNIILLRDSRVALIDFGAIGFLEQEYLEKFRLFLKSLATRNYDKAADIAFLLSTTLPVKDLEPIKEELVRSLHAWGTRTFVKDLPYEVKSVERAWTEISRIYARHQCTHAWEILRIRRAFSTLDASIMVLYPDANHTKLAQQYFREAQRRLGKKIRSAKTIRERLTSIAIAWETLPEKAAETLFFTASLVRRQAKVFEGETTKFANLFAVLFGKLVLLSALAGVFMLLLLLERYSPALVESMLRGPVYRAIHAAPELATDTWLVLLAADAYVCWTFMKLRRRFARKEERGDPSIYPP
jgi:ubiquinone biosynthesis protein